MGKNQRVVGHCDGWAQRGESKPDVRVTPDLTGSVGFMSSFAFPSTCPMPFLSASRCKS
jgi:hypothetical protein